MSNVNIEELDWKRVAYLLHVSRACDEVEETKLLPEKKVLYQFTARGHDMAQIILGSFLNHKRDSASAYYRSRPLLLTLGLPIVDGLAGPLMKSGGFSDGRDIGVVCNLPNVDGPCVLPMSGDVGSQFTPTAGWAQAVQFHSNVLKDESYKGAIGTVLGGEASVATNGFWSCLTMATTLKLPLLFYIEDNGFGISVPSELQTPGADISKNLASFRNLYIQSGDGTEPEETATIFSQAVSHVRSGKGPALVRLTVPRLSGHSGQDTQAYKSETLIKEEQSRDPLPKLKSFLVPSKISEDDWNALADKANEDVKAATDEALNRPEPDPNDLEKYIFSESSPDGSPDLQIQGGLLPGGHKFPSGSLEPTPEPKRTNMLSAIRRTLQHELKTNPKLLVFGEDVGPKGGVHAATLGLQEEFGPERVFDTSLSEEGIIGRAAGMAYAGLLPCPEIQFRKYADPATEQLHNCGLLRWRTKNKFAAPMIVRMPGGFSKCGDPWHSMCDEVHWVHSTGWHVAYPSNAEDAAGLLRSALRGNDPVIFFEHRNLLDATWARRPYPGDDYIVPFGKASFITEGSDITIVSWGALVERAEEAAKSFNGEVEVIDLRTVSPWDKEAVIESVNKTRRCLIIHEDILTAGFGAEIAAVVTEECFFNLDAPISRLAPTVPSPHNIGLLEASLPSVEEITNKIEELLET